MAQLTFIDFSGTAREVQAENGSTVMEAAIKNGIPGIERYSGPDGYFEVGATNNPTPKKGTIIKKYPKAIKLGETTYRYFTLKADETHLKSIGDTITFL